MSALFDDAERFDSLIVVGDTVRRVKDTTDDHVGPGTYTPSMAHSRDFGHIGVSTSRRSNMDPPLSSRSTEHQRYSNGSVVRDGVWFHTSPFLAAGPGPGEYSPPVISSEHERGRTAKPSSGTVGRQAWDLRGNAGGVPLTNFRDGCTVSSSMGTAPRLADFSHVALRSGVLLLRGPDDGHRTNGIGPGEYEGKRTPACVSNRQDPTTKRSYNMRAQRSQLHRERSRSFSGTSSTAKAFLLLAASDSARRPRGRQKDAAAAVDGRPDLHLLGRRADPTSAMAATPGVTNGGRGRCMSPASAMLSSMRVRASAGTSGAKSIGPRPGEAREKSAHKLQAVRVKPRHGFAARVSPALVDTRCPHNTSTAPVEGNWWSGLSESPMASKDCRSLSPRGGGRASGGFRPISPRRQHAAPASTSAPSSPFRSRPHRNFAANSLSSSHRTATGARGAWRGLEAVTAARAEVRVSFISVDSLAYLAPCLGFAAGALGDVADEKAGPKAGQTAVGGGGGPGSLSPEGMPPTGVCSPAQDTRDDLHAYFEAVNRTTDALGGTGGTNLSAPPSPRPLRPGSA
ncbi:unnamed protein product [Scytosiphon promiscuus]